MTVQLTVAFSSLLVEYEYLVALNQCAYYFANHFRTLYGRSTYGDVAFIVYQKNSVEFYCCTGFCILQVLNKQFFASFCLELLAVDFYNCVHCLYIMYKLAPSGGL